MGFAKAVDLTILGGLQKVPTTKITTTTTTGPSSNSYNNNNNNDDDDGADDDEDDDNNETPTITMTMTTRTTTRTTTTTTTTRTRTRRRTRSNNNNDDNNNDNDDDDNDADDNEDAARSMSCPQVQMKSPSLFPSPDPYRHRRCAKLYNTYVCGPNLLLVPKQLNNVEHSPPVTSRTVDNPGPIDTAFSSQRRLWKLNTTSDDFSERFLPGAANCHMESYHHPVEGEGGSK